MESYHIMTGIAAALLLLAAALVVQPSLAYDLTTALPVPLQNNEQLSPADRVSLNDVIAKNDGIAIKIPGPVLYAIADTNSMDPVIDKESTVIAIDDEPVVGDIVIYRTGSTLIIHRIVEIGEDEAGKYYIPKGDNNGNSDGKIRRGQIEAVVIGILY